MNKTSLLLLILQIFTIGLLLVPSLNHFSSSHHSSTSSLHTQFQSQTNSLQQEEHQQIKKENGNMLTLYEVTIPVFLRNLRNLNKILEKGVAYTKTEGVKVTEEELLGSRLIEDMGGFVFQIQRVSDAAKGLAQRIGGVEPVVLQDNEKTFPELFTRIQKTIEILEKVKPEHINAQEDAVVKIQGRSAVFTYSAKEYALTVALPNFYFHYTTTYNLLRKAGVPIGKGDYLL